MADGVIALKVFPGGVQIRCGVWMAGQDELGQVKRLRIAGVVLDRAAERSAPRFAGLQLVTQRIGEGGGLELEAMHVAVLPHAMEDHEVAAFRPRLGVVVEEDNAEDDVLAFRRVHVVAELAGGAAELGGGFVRF